MSSDKVRPGEIISSDLMNAMLKRLGELEGKVANLEPGKAISPVQITGFEPPGQVEEEKELVVHGTNFFYPPDRNTVQIDGKAVKAYIEKGCSSSRLQFIVPDLSLPSGGKTVTVLVENVLGGIKADYRILRSTEPVGKPPEIKKVIDFDGNDKLMLGKMAIISGKNFAKQLNQNIIKLVAPSGTLRPTEMEYPSGDKSLTIDPNQSDPPEVLVVSLPTLVELKKEFPGEIPVDTIIARFKVIVDSLSGKSDDVEIQIKNR